MLSNVPSSLTGGMAIRMKIVYIDLSFEYLPMESWDRSLMDYSRRERSREGQTDIVGRNWLTKGERINEDDFECIWEYFSVR